MTWLGNYCRCNCGYSWISWFAPNLHRSALCIIIIYDASGLSMLWFHSNSTSDPPWNRSAKGSVLLVFRTLESEKWPSHLGSHKCSTIFLYCSATPESLPHTQMQFSRIHPNFMHKRKRIWSFIRSIVLLFFRIESNF